VALTPAERALRIKELRTKRLAARAIEASDRRQRIGKLRNGNDSPPKHERRARGSLSREEIVLAAAEILQSEGLDALSMRRIADKLKCSVASPYAHFENQEEILRILVVEGERKLTGDLRHAQNSSEDAYLQLDAIAHGYWTFATENRELHRLMFSASGGKLYRRSFPTLPTSYRVFLETIRRGISSGAIPHSRKSYPGIARTMWAWMYGLIVLDLNGMVRHAKGSDPVEEGISMFIKMLRSGDSPLRDRRVRS